MIHRKNLIKLIEASGYRHSSWQVFSDFVEMAAISISNAVDWAQREARERRYAEIISRYDAEEAGRFPRMLGELVMELEASGPADVLGQVFMEMELMSKWHGQFFTPYELCRMMSRMMVDDQMRDLIERRGFIRANEPACGGGAMIIAMAEEMHKAGINYQQHLHVVAQDVDAKAVHMAYIQLSLLHIPAIVIQGNTIALEERAHWLTPAHIMGGWHWRLSRAEQPEQIRVEPAASAPEQIVIRQEPRPVAPARSQTENTNQLSLF